tara:strand:- start:8334 stop:8543 length:210 start_codon:yes stop_codon:yes gene_type:complete
MKNLEITEDCFVKGEPVEAGVVLENVENGVAAQLLTSGRAKIAPEKPKKKAAKKAAKKADKKVDADGDS